MPSANENSTFDMFDNKKVKIVQDAMEAAMQPVAEKLGLSLKQHGGTFDAGHFDMKFRVLEKEPDGTVKDPMEEDYRQFASVYGLDPAWLGQGFRSGTNAFTVAGLKLKRGGKVYLIGRKAENGRLYRFLVDQFLLLHKAQMKPVVTTEK